MDKSRGFDRNWVDTCPSEKDALQEICPFNRDTLLTSNNARIYPIGNKMIYISKNAPLGYNLIYMSNF
jgi:hypothetical protein